MRIIKGLYLSNRFFWGCALIVILFCASFLLPSLFVVSQVLLIALVIVTVIDVFFSFSASAKVECERILPEYFSLADENAVTLVVHNRFSFALRMEVYDEIPEQFQERNFKTALKVSSGKSKEIAYKLRPVLRGAYHFGKVNVFVSSGIGLLQYRLQRANEVTVKVYPSILQMRKYELMLSNKTATAYGVRKLRRLGHSYEFEKIKNYVDGDDIRSINWKATCRKDNLMVNQYEDEKSQSVYCVIDKSRSMMLPFDGLSLLDYSINTSLALSNMVLKKDDRMGLITFSNKTETVLKADSKTKQLGLILENLYKEKENHLEANYEHLFLTLNNVVKNRSLIFLFANFESLHAIKRVLGLLRKINQRHLLVLMIFENTEIESYSKQPAESMEDIYLTTIAEKFIHDKYRILQELKNYGIQVVVNKPNDLSVNAINKYMQLKSRGLI
ncbi:MAG: DUF58 domain-containing protein [Bacteroidetes bacterium]|nr:DUF58 domain-containing protein [Bacteroidota bacterium]